MGVVDPGQQLTTHPAAHPLILHQDGDAVQRPKARKPLGQDKDNSISEGKRKKTTKVEKAITPHAHKETETQPVSNYL